MTIESDIEHVTQQDTESTTSSSNETRSSSETPVNTKYSILCYPCNKFYKGNRDAIGYALLCFADGAATGKVFQIPAILNLAKEAAGCPTEDSIENSIEASECTNTVYGFRPSSLLTAVVIPSALIYAILPPLVGAIIDHTKYRKRVGQISAALVLCCSVVPVFISEKTWFPILITGVMASFINSIQSTASQAYLPELTDDQNVLSRYNSSYAIISTSTGIVLLTAILIMAFILDVTEDYIFLARFSQIVVVCMYTVFLGFAWLKFFSRRPAFMAVPEGHTLFTTGFKTLFATGRKIQRYLPAIKWCLCGAAFSNSATMTLATVMTSYGTYILEFTTVDFGFFLLTASLTTIPGAAIAPLISRRMNPLRSLQLGTFLWIFATVIAAVVLRGPEQKLLAFAFVAVWGILSGWCFPTEKTLYVTIIPENHDAELMGIHLFATAIIAWLPPLVFTAMNQAGISMRIGLGVIGVYYLISFLSFLMIGNFENAVSQAKKSLEDRDMSITEQDFQIAIEDNI